MPKKPLEAIEEYFSKVSDPRVDRTKEHKLIDIIAMAICAVICGAEGWTDFEDFGSSKLPWLKTFLELPNGVASHDTFGRVFGRMDAQQFQLAFYEWVWAVNDIIQGQIINLDGKQLRGSKDLNIRNEVPVRCLTASTRRSRIEVPRVDYEKLSGDRMGETSGAIRARVQAAHDIQNKRFSSNGSSDIVANADMRVGEIRQFCRLQDEGQSLMRAAMSQLNLSARAYHRTRSVKLARTIADLAGSEEIQSVHLAEALQYRPKLMMG